MNFIVLIGLVALIPLSSATQLTDDLYDETEDNELFREERQQCPTITFPCSRMKTVCANMRAAIRSGKPSRLNRITNKLQVAKNRRASGCPKLKKRKGKNCDEYPFASSQQGGKGARIMLVPIKENSLQGGLLSAFYKKNNIGNGGCYNVKLR